MGQEGSYEVSSLGRVRSVPRIVHRQDGKPLPVKARVLKTWTDSKGYVISTIKGPQRKVHRLVCEAFHGPPPPGKDQVRHLDGDPSNNHPANLRWGTAKENYSDIISMGRNWNQQKTSCPRGHPYPGFIPGTVRRCKACEAIRRETRDHPDPDAHGRYSTYLNWYCRCIKCREAFNEYQRNYRRRKYADVDPGLREHGNPDR